MRITFEGEHRSGKGTQIELYKDRSPLDLLVVRGDGSYQGGLDGILDDSEISIRENLNSRLYDAQDEKTKMKLWSAAATLCASVVASPRLVDRDLLIDRGPLSRASFLLSAGLEGKELIENMYPAYSIEDNEGLATGDALDVEDIDFGRIIYIKVPTQVLLERVSDDDPKRDFRKKNIRNKEGLFERAIDSMPRSVRTHIEVIDGNKHPEDVLKSYSL